MAKIATSFHMSTGWSCEGHCLLQVFGCNLFEHWVRHSRRILSLLCLKLFGICHVSTSWTAIKAKLAPLQSMKNQCNCCHRTASLWHLYLNAKLFNANLLNEISSTANELTLARSGDLGMILPQNLCQTQNASRVQTLVQFVLNFSYSHRICVAFCWIFSLSCICCIRCICCICRIFSQFSGAGQGS